MIDRNEQQTELDNKQLNAEMEAMRAEIARLAQENAELTRQLQRRKNKPGAGRPSRINQWLTKYVLEYHNEGLPYRKIAESLDASLGTVEKIIQSHKTNN
jgi:DNA-binding NarL/FixJ family response regulator